MANMASVTYVIEGSSESLDKILAAISLAVATDDNKYEEYKACLNLGFTETELEGKRLGGEISEEPEIRDGALRFWSEERWDLQDFEELLRQKFSDIKIYWIVEESGCEVYRTNDKEGRYFSDRWYCEIVQDGFDDFEYFKTEEGMYKWLSKKTQGRVHDAESAEEFNQDYAETGDECENYINIHKFEVSTD